MCPIKYTLFACIILSSIVVSCNFDTPKPTVPSSSDTTVVSKRYVGKSDWSVYMDAPRYHFALAMEYLRKGEYSKSSGELARGNSFLLFQVSRISVVVKEIEKLSKSLESGKHDDIASMGELTMKAMKVLSNEYVMLPLDVSDELVFKEEYDYLFDKAITDMRNNNRSDAADQIGRASALIRLKATYTGRFTEADLDSAEKELVRLSSRVESGAVIDTNILESTFQKIAKFFNKEKL